MESEYIACVTTIQEALWLGRFLQTLREVPHATKPVVIHSDSMAAIAYVKDPKYMITLST